MFKTVLIVMDKMIGKEFETGLANMKAVAEREATDTEYANSFCKRPTNLEVDMSYVDGFVVPVPRKNLAAYRRMAQKAGKVWKAYGALEYKEWVSDDVKVGKVTSFPRSVKLKPGETVVFSWIVYKSRAHRDRVNAKVMKDPRLADMMDPKSMPFDGKRLIYGGFKKLVFV